MAAKNQDNREHDIVDSDDYFQYHGGMVDDGAPPDRAVRLPRTSATRTCPMRSRTRTLGEETHRVFRSRVVNPRWIAAMQRHGYKGAFEMAATVDYLFGFDATAGVVDDWMYESLAAEYVFDAEVARVHAQVQSLGAARHHRAAARSRRPRACGPSPTPETLDQLRATYLELEGDLEGDAAGRSP